MNAKALARCTSGRVLLTVAAVMVGSTGCAATSRRVLSPGEQLSFRSASLNVLKQAAMGDDPVLRMHAIEAFQEVAPAEGLQYIAANIDNGYAGVSFASLMALGKLRAAKWVDQIRTRAEDSDPNVVIAALYALHRLGDQRRTGELPQYLLKHRDVRVRANAALAIGRLGEPKSVKLLRTALRREKKSAVKLQILEALAMQGDRHAIERLIFDGHSAIPDQAALALMFLASAKCPEAEDLFLYRLSSADHPEIKLQAARGLGRLGFDDGLELATSYLRFNSPQSDRPHDPPEQQIRRVRVLAALALEAIGSPDALGPLKDAFEREGQDAYVRLAIARAAIRIMDLQRSAISHEPSAACHD